MSKENFNGGPDYLIDPTGWMEFHKKTCDGCSKCSGWMRRTSSNHRDSCTDYNCKGCMG